MSKKRLYKKNIKTKKIKGGVDSPLLDDLAKQAGSTVANTTSRLIDPFTNQLTNVAKQAETTVANTTSDVTDAITNVANTTSDVTDAITNVAKKEESSVESKVSAMTKGLGVTDPLDMAKGLGVPDPLDVAKRAVPGLSALGDAYSNLKKLKVQLTEEDKFNHALLKLRTNPEFYAYFTTTIHNILVYKILTHSKNYLDIVKNTVDKENKYYDEKTSDYTPTCKYDESKDDNDDKTTNLDKITKDENIKEFLKNAMTINTPVIEKVFENLINIINQYNDLIIKVNDNKVNDNKVNDNNYLSNEAMKQIDAIIREFDMQEKSGVGDEPVAVESIKIDIADEPVADESIKIDEPVADESIKPIETIKNDEPIRPVTDVVDDFYNSMLWMCIQSKEKISKLLKLKLYGILNKIINQLYDIANERKKLVTDGEPNKFDIGDFSNEKKESDSSSVDSSSVDLKIVEFQKIIVKIVKQLFCKILEKTHDEPFIEFVKTKFENLGNTLKKGGNLKKLGKKITRKSSSRVSRKTRRHKRTSR
jgi:predicted DNA-binding ribbon-helix-helix protein